MKGWGLCALHCWKIRGLTIILLLLSGCAENLDFSPYVTKSREQGLTQQALDKLAAASSASFFPFKFTVLSDTHAYYKDTQDAIEQLRSRHADAAFALIVGDISDHGLLEEYERSKALFDQIGTPYLVAIGNHDALSNGKQIYPALFGPLNYAFQFNNVKFIVFNNNQQAYGAGVPDFAWLEAQLADAASFQHVVLVGHVSPFDALFSAQTQQRFRDLMAQHNVDLVISGHAHNRDSQLVPRLDGGNTEYLIAGSVDKRLYNVVQVSASGVVAQAEEYRQ